VVVVVEEEEEEEEKKLAGTDYHAKVRDLAVVATDG